MSPMASEHHDRCFDENWKNANHPKYLMNYDIEDVYLKNTIKRGLTGFLNCLVCLWL
jgi:hypothetical protein